jgi:hypothetical protein
MSLRHRIRILLAFLGVMSIVLTTSSVSAASVASSKDPLSQTLLPLQLQVRLCQLLPPQAYRTANPTATFFTDTHTLPYLSNIAYYVASGNFQLQPKQGTYIAGVELASNPTTHTQLLALGTPTSAYWTQKAQDDAKDSTSGSSQSGSSQSSGQSSSMPRSALAVPYKPYWMGSHYMQTNWYDPFGIHLLEVQDTLLWNFNGSIVLPGWSHSSNWWYDSDTFWGLDYLDAEDYYILGQTEVYAWTYANFSNDWFCTLVNLGNQGPTYVYYHTNTITGAADGSWTGSVYTFADGGCYDWLYASFVAG